MGRSTENKPIVSVVMPVYNQQPYVEEAVRSILVQTFTDFELVAIDDGSTDDSLQILQRLAGADARIRVYSQENRGRAATRNRGLELARADLVAMMDPDDVAMPERLALQMTYMEAHPECVALGGQFESVCMEGLPLFASDLPLEHVGIEARLLDDDGQALHQGVSILRRRVCLEAGGYDQRYASGEDTDLFLRMALKGRLANLPEVLLRYRQHPKNTFNTPGRPEYLRSLERMESAWRARGKILPPDYRHWSQTMPEVTAMQLMLRWGWNALRLGEAPIAKRYGIRLLRKNPLNMAAWRLLYCIARGR